MANPRASNTDDFASTDFSTRTSRTIKEYIGFSYDLKPYSTDENTLQYGSTFYEQDTAKTFKWDGFSWNTATDYGAAILNRLDQLIDLLTEMKAVHEEQLSELTG